MSVFDGNGSAAVSNNQYHHASINGSNGNDPSTHHGGVITNHSHYKSDHKPLLELYVKASGIENRRIGACLFCQEFWMELYALYEVGVVRVEVKTVNVNSEAFKKKLPRR